MMDFNFLECLSNADSIASNEQEVRNLLKEKLSVYKDTFQYDGLGSLILTKKSKVPNAKTVMFAAHMDEVGFMVRYISDIGFAYLMPIGGVEDRAKSMQMVRVKTQNGNKIRGLLNVTFNSNHEVDQMYVDFGFNTKQEVLNTGVDVGDMICFDSEYKELTDVDVFAGKALDDRVGCWSLAQAMLDIFDKEVNVNVVAAFTSSEEVGTRGGKLVTNVIKPDIFFAIDVAKNPEFDRGYTNTRKLGHGPMLEFFDKTMVPNPRFLQYVTNLAKKNGLQYQKDMFKGGGTDAGLAHLQYEGISSIVIGIPLRYCHDPYSFANKKDLVVAKNLIECIALNIEENSIRKIYKF